MRKEDSVLLTTARQLTKVAGKRTYSRFETAFLFTFVAFRFLVFLSPWRQIEGIEIRPSSHGIARRHPRIAHDYLALWSGVTERFGANYTSGECLHVRRTMTRSSAVGPDSK